MKSLISKRLIYCLTKFRVFAIAFVLGVLGFWIWQSQTLIPQSSTVFVVEFPSAPPPQQTIVEDRNLFEYEQFEISCASALNSDYQNCVNSYKNGREFILKHWREKKRAYIIHKDTHFFIEPDNKENWHIIIRSKWNYTVVGWEKLFKVEKKDAISVKLKKENDNFYSNYSSGFYLQFLDKNGEEIHTL